MGSSSSELRIDRCHACGKPHDKVTATPYKSEKAPWTHWFMCPDRNEPADIAILDQGGKTFQVHQEALMRLVQAQRSGSWMAMFLHINEGSVDLYRITHQFPMKDFTTAVRLVYEDIEREAGPPEKKALAEAEPPTPAVQLFDNADS